MIYHLLPLSLCSSSCESAEAIDQEAADLGIVALQVVKEGKNSCLHSFFALVLMLFCL